ncbi:hypothetical protein E1B28_008289 [Marasmius oreades]|uniref:Uncharacterized protein n=1 Tax=Marasmius oreades TaxID=181124 RepID=A0A9P7RZM6_9AGAR|nr:uncharacterized protein E1B28_008289 [Marasmius oreades]KAG7091888.1 hypothetical protein E1B28_008289 [Marasmius oreades]
MPSFTDLKSKAVKAKDASVSKIQNVKDHNTSVSMKKTNWNPYNGEGPRPPPPLRVAPKPDLPPFLPPPRRTSSNASTGSGASNSTGPPPINRATRTMSSSPTPLSTGPPPIVRSTRPSLSAQSSQSSYPTPPSLPARSSSSAISTEKSSPPALPSRTASVQRDQIPEEPTLNWAALSQDDKEAFFSWLDEFFEKFYGIKAS